jgi:hypothetical protein
VAMLSSLCIDTINTNDPQASYVSLHQGILL